MKVQGGTFVIGILLAGLALFGPLPAASAAKPEPPAVKSLLGKKFESISLKGAPIIKGKTIRLHFFRQANHTGEQKRPTLRVSGACNAWGSGFRIRNGRLVSQGKFVGTKVACRPDPDPWLQSNFRKGLKARIVGRRLILTRPAERVRFVFKPVAKSQPVIDEPDLSIPAGDPVTVETLEGRTFKSVKVIGEQVDETIELGFEKGRLGVYLGCNRMSGDYRIGGSETDWRKDGILRWSNLLTTDMACQGSKDSWFSGLLDAGVEATVNDSWLVLAHGKTTVVFRKVAESDPPERVPAGEPSTVESLDGRSFESISVIGRRLATPIEIAFKGNGLGAYLGCNWLGGEYSLEDGELLWLEPLSTLMGCYGGGNERDSWFRHLVQEGVEVSESGNGLIFDRGSTQIVFKEVPSNQVSAKFRD